jgi:RNA polymerase primary sigma factor
MRALVISHGITKRDSRSVEKYLNDISKFEVMSPEEELRTFQRFKAGDEDAFQRIIRCNLRFVVSVAKQYQHLGLSLNDLINEGNIGLVKAARRFDETKGFKFISYAVWWIRQMMLQSIANKSRKIRLPANQQSVTMRIIAKRNDLLHQLEREPTTEELVEATEMSEEIINRSMETYRYCQSLDASIDEDGDYSLTYFLEDDNIRKPDADLVGSESLKVEIQEMLKHLNQREAQIVSMCYGIGCSQPVRLEDIGLRVGLTKERVRQIRDRGINKLRKMVANEDLTFSWN